MKVFIYVLSQLWKRCIKLFLLNKRQRLLSVRAKSQWQVHAIVVWLSLMNAIFCLYLGNFMIVRFSSWEDLTWHRIRPILFLGVDYFTWHSWRIVVANFIVSYFYTFYQIVYISMFLPTLMFLLYSEGTTFLFFKVFITYFGILLYPTLLLPFCIKCSLFRLLNSF